jgi:hypothetical protein
MAKNLKAQRVRLMHNDGTMTLTRGLAEYLGIDDLVPNLGRTAKGRRRHARGGSAVAGVPYVLTLDDGSTWQVHVTGSQKAFEEAYFIRRPAPKMEQAVSPGLTILRPRVGL